jgi:tellurite resistance protein TehA-like permease
MLPYFVCSAYMIITPVILISYVLGHRMPEILIRIFNTLGGILFLVAGTVALLKWRDFRSNLQGKEDNVDKQNEAVFLLTTGVLCLVNSILYLFDVAISVHSALSSARK